jgi:ABC-type antimicrobial peptide transport system permease subunit
MFKNYLHIALRQLRKNRVYSFINIVGLATGMAIALIIGIWITGELSRDHDYPDGDRIAEIMQDQHGKAEGKAYSYTGKTVSSALKPFLQKDYDDVIAQSAITLWPGDALLVTGDKSISRKSFWVEYTFPLIFGYHFLSGTAESMRDPNTAVISRSTAIALYGTENAVGKTFKLGNQTPLTVGGVFANPPASSSFHDVEVLASIANDNCKWLMNNTDFENHSCNIYVRLAGRTTAEQATARIKKICTPFVKYATETYRVMPFEQLYLHYDDTNGSAETGAIGFVRLMGIIGVFVLLLACINFMNLSTARGEQRAKEVGIRKTIGSLRSQLIAQFLGESILLAVIAFVLAILLAASSLPWFSMLAGKAMLFPWASPVFWGLSAAFTILTGLIAGSYPAFYLSGFRPVKVLKGAFKAGRGASTPRKVLVVAQFSISLALIIGTVVVFRQLQLAKDRPIGYDRAGLITVPINTDSLDRHYESLRTALLNSGVIANMASSSTTLNNFSQNNFMEWEGMTLEQKHTSFRDILVSADFGPTIGWTIVKGRDFSRAFRTDSTAAIVNEEGARVLGFKDPIGKTVKHWGKNVTIIGVSKDMVNNNVYGKVQPAIFLGEGGHNVFTIRIRPGIPVHAALATMESVFRQYNPASPFIYQFNDEDFKQKYITETRIGNLATVFSGLAILISCLGLFGLASFVAEQRTKEIGVRKVLGARVVNLWALLSGEFLKLIVLSMLIAMPLAYYCMSQWLQNYPIHTDLPAWIFLASGAGILSITLATVSYQALKAALMNPVKSLRTE